MEIEILGISGSPIKNGNTVAFLQEALKAAEEIGGVTTSLLSLAGKRIDDCKQCNWCISKQEEGKYCALDDDMTEIFPTVLAADGILVATPVYLGRMSGHLAACLDRLRSCLHGKVYREMLIDKVGGALAVGWIRNGGLESALQSILIAFSAFGMIFPAPGMASTCAWGATGFSSEYGMGKFDPEERVGVLKDEFGLRSARSVGKRVAEVARIVRAGKKIIAG